MLLGIGWLVLSYLNLIRTLLWVCSFNLLLQIIVYCFFSILLLADKCISGEMQLWKQIIALNDINWLITGDSKPFAVFILADAGADTVSAYETMVSIWPFICLLKFHVLHENIILSLRTFDHPLTSIYKYCTKMPKMKTFRKCFYFGNKGLVNIFDIRKLSQMTECFSISFWILNNNTWIHNPPPFFSGIKNKNQICIHQIWKYFLKFLLHNLKADNLLSSFK